MRIFSLIVGVLFIICGLKAQTITVTDVVQDGQKIVVSYDFMGGSGNYDVSLFIATDDDQIWAGPLVYVTGDVGTGIEAGSQKRILWSGLSDLIGLDSDRIRFKVSAKISANQHIAKDLTTIELTEQPRKAYRGNLEIKLIPLSVKVDAKGPMPISKNSKDEFDEAGNNYDYQLYLFEDPILRKLILNELDLKEIAHYPLVKLKSVLNRRLQASSKEAKNEIGFQHTIRMKYEVLNDSLISFYNENYDFMGGAHGFFSEGNFVINTERRKILKLKDLISDTIALKSIIFTYFKKEEKNPKYQEMLYEYNRAAEMPLPESIKIERRRLLVHFPEYSIGAGLAGCVDINIPKSALKRVLRKDVFNCLID